MAFFDYMLAKSHCAHGYLSNIRTRAETVALCNAIDDNNAHLRQIHTCIQPERLTSGNVNSITESELHIAVAALFGSLDNTLTLLSSEIQQQKELPIFHPDWLQRSAKTVGIENQKLRSLLYTLNRTYISTSRTDISPEALEKRQMLTDQYMGLEIERLTRNSQKVDLNSHPRWTWIDLNKSSNHKHISPQAINRSNLLSLAELLHDVASHIYMAGLPTCDEDDRWVRLLLCSKYLQCARSSAEYRALLKMCDNSYNSGAFDLGFTVQNFVTELEIDTLGVLQNYRSLIPSPEIITSRSAILALHPTENNRSSSGELDEYRSANNSNHQIGGKLWTCTLHDRHNGLNLAIRLGSDGALFLDPDEGSNLEDLKDRDLRGMTFHPYYPTQEYPIHRCELTYEKNAKRKTIPKVTQIFFRGAMDLKIFQNHVTGFKVVADFNDNIMIRVHKRWSVSGCEKSYIGKLQIWDKKREKAPEEVVSKLFRNMTLPRAQTGFSSMSRASATSSLTLKTRDTLAARIENYDENSDSLVMDAPVAPLVVLLVQESPGDNKIYPGDLLAFGAPLKAVIETSMCDCVDDQNECRRCFIKSVKRVELKVGRHEYPRFPKSVDWIEVTFTNDIDRREFATKMRNQMKIHAGRRRDSVKRYRLVVENHTNTADFEKLNY